MESRVVKHKRDAKLDSNLRWNDEVRNFRELIKELRDARPLMKLPDYIHLTPENNIPC